MRVIAAQVIRDRDEDVVRLSPLKRRNVNVRGRHSFSAYVPRGGLRPLRNPGAPGVDDDDNVADED
ncbi:hypothetical protein ACWC0A_10950 [Streptomyces scopuliridis]